MTFDPRWAEETAEFIETPDDLRQFITEIALASWEESDQSADTLIALLGAIDTAKQMLFMHLGDRLNDE